MNRAETIQAMAMKADIPKSAAQRVLEAFETHLKAHANAGNRIVLRGFGSFSKGAPTPKVGRNPQTGQPLTYTAYHKVKGAPSISEAVIRDQVAGDTGVSEAATGRALDGLQDVIVAALKKGDVVTFYGFGSFSVGLRAARNGRNPRTGASIIIPAARVPRFHASKAGNTGGKFSPGVGLKAAIA